MANYQWVAWVISACALAYAILKDLLSSRKADTSHRRELDAAVERRLQELEVGRKVDRAEILGEFRLINAKMGQAQGQVSQVKNLLNDILQ
jgi:hypothetical protein